MTITTAAASLLIAALAPTAAPSARIVVSPDGPLRSIAEAVRAAPAGALVIVRAGTYREPAIVVDRPLTLADRKSVV